MATSRCRPEEFSCPVCLEILCDPGTLPCGHTYCLQCIQKHWDKAAAKGIYSCPQCRQVFNPRPTLGRNNMLMEAMKKLRVQEQDDPPSPVHSSLTSSAAVFVDSSSQPAPLDGAEGAVEGVSVQGGLYPQLPFTSPKMCPLHQQVLELYCCDDKESVCDECSLLGHKGHRVVRPDEEKEEKQQELEQKKEMIQKSIQAREKVIQTLPQVLQAHKNAIQGLQRYSLETFADVVKNVELMSSQVMQLLQTYEASSYNHIEADRYRLQQEISQLCKQQEELNRLANTQDSIQFLNALVMPGAVGQVENAQLEISHPELVEAGIRSALGTFREGLNDLCKGSLASIFRAVNDAAARAPPTNAQASETGPVPNDLQVASQKTAPEMTVSSSNSKPEDKTSHSAAHQHPPAATAQPAKEAAAFNTENPAPKTRDEMIKFRFEPTLDPNSAYRHIRLSEGDHKATLRAENQNYPEHADRFLYWRQVMCREPLAGSPYYWEVEWTGQKVTIGVAYKDMARSAADDSSRLGHNEHSWSLYWSGTAFSLWHAGKETTLAAPKARHIGVYLDQQAGLLAFYRVSHNQAHQICCVETEFSAPLYPGFRFWSGVGSTITLCHLD
ncbi:finTRIM family, member 86 isoform X2 [Colossoma macropomum]|uniref:finTRIM family, member 86 isoform X2 n=1 Tax=Colossoma macropomum TaxID=42526 RepID=UPI001863AC4D|nr:finTRIM family, member 86 isoform X2 [Colossoma macropomum]